MNQTVSQIQLVRRDGSAAMDVLGGRLFLNLDEDDSYSMHCEDIVDIKGYIYTQIVFYGHHDTFC